jgi:hypothetical protein
MYAFASNYNIKIQYISITQKPQNKHTYPCTRPFTAYVQYPVKYTKILLCIFFCEKIIQLMIRNHRMSND